MTLRLTRILSTSALCALAVSAAQADQVFADDVIINGGSLCVGFDCVNGESFGADTLRLKENNLRIHAQDTSNSASFPGVDWRLTFNDSTNGGQNKFSVDVVDTGASPFVIESGAASNAVYVDDAENVGLGTTSPVVELHVVDGDSPTLRLQQDGSSGFGQQTWDLAGNETNFFVRNVNNSSALPFRIFPGSGTDDALVIEGTGDVGLGTDSPDANLHLIGSSGLLIEESDSGVGPNALIHVRGGSIIAEDDASVNLTLVNTADTTADFRMQLFDTVRFSYVGSGVVEMELDDSGNLKVAGTISSGGSQLNVPDYVFEDDYDLRPLTEVQAFIDANSHLPEVPSAAEIAEGGLNMSEMQMTLLKKVEELTLYTLAQEDRIAALSTELEALRAE